MKLGIKVKAYILILISMILITSSVLMFGMLSKITITTSIAIGSCIYGYGKYFIPENDEGINILDNSIPLTELHEKYLNKPL